VVILINCTLSLVVLFLATNFTQGLRQQKLVLRKHLCNMTRIWWVSVTWNIASSVCFAPLFCPTVLLVLSWLLCPINHSLALSSLFLCIDHFFGPATRVTCVGNWPMRTAISAFCDSGNLCHASLGSFRHWYRFYSCWWLSMKIEISPRHDNRRLTSVHATLGTNREIGAKKPLSL